MWTCNQLPHADHTNVSPDNIFFGTIGGSSQLHCACAFRCPTHALYARLQDGKKIPKWESQARTGMFLDFSYVHLSAVGLTMNIWTGHVLPQHDLVCDEKFETVASDCSIDLSET